MASTGETRVFGGLWMFRVLQTPSSDQTCSEVLVAQMCSWGSVLLSIEPPGIRRWLSLKLEKYFKNCVLKIRPILRLYKIVVEMNGTEFCWFYILFFKAQSVWLFVSHNSVVFDALLSSTQKKWKNCSHISLGCHILSV